MSPHRQSQLESPGQWTSLRSARPTGSSRLAAAAVSQPPCSVPRLLTRGSYLGIDRFATAVGASAVRNREYIERGTARFEQQAVQDVDPTRLPSFDKVFVAVSVNLF
jgi:hypothetical protein